MTTMNARSGGGRRRRQGANHPTSVPIAGPRSGRRSRPAHKQRARSFATTICAVRSSVDATWSSERASKAGAVWAAAATFRSAIEVHRAKPASLRLSRARLIDRYFSIPLDAQCIGFGRESGLISLQLRFRSKTDRQTCAPAQGPRDSARRAGVARYLIEYFLISNDQLLGCNLPVPGSGTRNLLVHSVR